MIQRFSVYLINEMNSPKHIYANLICRIQTWCKKDWLIYFHHSFREGNYAIDLLAGQEHNIPLGIQQLEVPPFGLKFLLWIDFVGTIFPRRVHL